MDSGRQIIIGDLHGCYEEAKEILRLTDFRPGKDRLYLCGDHINKGPDSYGCFRLRKETGAVCVIGNHEQKFIAGPNGNPAGEKTYRAMKKEFGGEFDQMVEEISKLPYYWIEENFTLVHAGLTPGKGPQESSPQDLMNIRTVTDNETGKSIPWYEYYHSPKLLIFGHWAQLRGILRKNLAGLDMGCVYGNQLRALILPQREIVDVPAKETYCSIDAIRAEYRKMEEGV